MKTAKLTVGILSIVFSLIILFQSCAAGISDALANNRGTSGSTGGAVALFFLVSGIVGIVARKAKGGAIASGALYLIGGLIGISNVGTYKDLLVWSILSFIFAALFIISIFLGQTYPSKQPKADEDKKDA